MLLTAPLLFLGAPGMADTFQAIQPMPSGTTVTLTGHDLTLDQIVRVARYGERVELSPEAVRHEEDAYRLLLEGAAEGVPIAGFNRTEDGARAVFAGDPTSPENATAISQRLLQVLRAGAVPAGQGATEEEAVRAAMVVRLNTLIYTPARPAMLRLLVALLNDGITPVTAPGHALLRSIGAAMVGAGDVYVGGTRMKAAAALASAGLSPLDPAGMDDHALLDGNSDQLAATALLVADSHRALDWADMVAALDLDASNANIAPLSVAAEANRPYRWINWDALRVLDMLKGGVLFDADPTRGDSLPGGLRASLIAQGTAWMEDGVMRDILAVALNSSDQSPAVRVGLSTRESFELGTPQLARYWVKGGKANGGKRGFIVDTINDDDAPVRLALGGFVAALAALDRDVATRIGATPPATGAAGDTAGIIENGRVILADIFNGLAVDFGRAAAALDQHGDRNPGVGPAAVLAAWREAVAASPGAAKQDLALRFLKANALTAFFKSGDPSPGADEQIPLAQERIRR